MRMDLAHTRYQLGQFHICVSQCKKVVTAARLSSAKLFESRQNETVATVVSNAYELMADALQRLGPSKFSRALNVYVLSLRENPSNTSARSKLTNPFEVKRWCKIGREKQAKYRRLNRKPSAKVQQQNVLVRMRHD